MENELEAVKKDLYEAKNKNTMLREENKVLRDKENSSKKTVKENNICKCEEFAPGLEKINGPIILQQTRTGTRIPEDYFTPWLFCPWCGDELEEV